MEAVAASSLGQQPPAASPSPTKGINTRAAEFDSGGMNRSQHLALGGRGSSSLRLRSSTAEQRLLSDSVTSIEVGDEEREQEEVEVEEEASTSAVSCGSAAVAAENDRTIGTPVLPPAPRPSVGGTSSPRKGRTRWTRGSSDWLKKRLARVGRRCCAMRGRPNLMITVLLCVLAVYGALASVLGQSAVPFISIDLSNSTLIADFGGERKAPDGTVFGIYVIVVLCMAAGWLCSLIHVPPLLGWFGRLVVGLFLLPIAIIGMLCMGIVVRNVGAVAIFQFVDKKWAGILRRSALVIVLVSGGLGLDLQALRKLKAACLRLAFIPCIVEGLSVGIISRFVMGLPWFHAFMLGFVLGAVSPAVCVPSMLALQGQGLGVDEGIPTLVIAASSVDDVLAITIFSVLLSLVFSQGGLVWTIIGGPIEVGIGIIYGLVLGFLLWVFPDENQKRRNELRFCLLISGCMLSMFGSGVVNVDGAGPIGCLVAAVVLNYKYSRSPMQSQQQPPPQLRLPRTTATQSSTTNDVSSVRSAPSSSLVGSVGEHKKYIAAGWKETLRIQHHGGAVSSAVSLLWEVPFQQLLFGLIGSELDLSSGGVDVSSIGRGLAVLLAGLLFRSVAAFLAVGRTGLDWKERTFVAISWLPKATVQAAIGPLAYDKALEKGSNQETVRSGFQVLTVAVLSILLTAPIGACLMSLSGPYLLRRSEAGATVVVTGEPGTSAPGPPAAQLDDELSLTGSRASSSISSRYSRRLEQAAHRMSRL